MEKINKSWCGLLRYKLCVYDLRTVAQFAYGAVHNAFPVLFGKYIRLVKQNPIKWEGEMDA